jgi:hypothetical protein
MLVYGDPSREVCLADMVGKLRDSLACLRDSARANALEMTDCLRGVLITAGELEQAIADAPAGSWPSGGEAALESAVRLTDAAAHAFLALTRVAASSGMVRGQAIAAVAQILSALESFGEPKDAPLQVKVPEGFAFYALYPEQYVQVAAQWLRDNPPGQNARVLVVGVRSIGTSLSAVVAAVLRAGGWDVRRLTVRPEGHPFDRKVDIPAELVTGADRALIVDEGPGLSGSSMACCAESLARGGVDRKFISFFPGHDRMPGAATSPGTRKWWDTTRRYVVPIHALRWGGQSLKEVLARATANLRQTPVVRTEDLSGGLWRSIVFSEESQWPAVCGTFERMKVRVVLHDGSSVLWKFAGLDDARESVQQEKLARAGWTTPVLDQVLGFVASPWIDGRRLMRQDADDEMLMRIGRYIRAATHSPLAGTQRRICFQRLCDMACCNAGESLGPSAARRAREIADAVEASMESSDLPAYGDGRMAPHEWALAGDGSIVKTDCGGHDTDHTIVGPQPAAWDLAGAAVEWGLDRRQTAALTVGFGAKLEDPVLTFYELAYAAFRTGQCSMCAQMSESDPRERERLERAAGECRRRMDALLHSALS